jgi:hypothetical protein
MSSTQRESEYGYAKSRILVNRVSDYASSLMGMQSLCVLFGHSIKSKRSQIVRFCPTFLEGIELLSLQLCMKVGPYIKIRSDVSNLPLYCLQLPRLSR